MNDEQAKQLDAAVIEHLHVLDTMTQADQKLIALIRGMSGSNPPEPPVLPQKSKGIDVSHWQGAIDWGKVKAAGIVFAFIKATEGISGLDSQFASNWRNAKSAEIMRGAYHYYRFAYDPIAQADFFVSHLGDDLGELPPVIDVEEDVKVINAETSIKVFCDHVFQLIGKRCVIYTGGWWWTISRLGNPQPWVKDYPLWLAAYVDLTKINQFLPKDWSAWSFWQFSNTGHIDGIAGNVDLDVSA